MRYALLLFGSSLGVFGCAASQPTPTCPEAGPIEASFPEGETQLAAIAGDITWVTCPPALPAGCEMAVLEGDPRQEMMFTVRFRTSDQFEMKPHWHPGNERVTIIEGKVGVGFGDQIDRENVTWFGPGDYYVNASGAHHFVLADEPSIVQITGIGPWKANYLDTE